MKRLLIAVLFIIVLILPGCIPGGTPDQGAEIPDQGEIPEDGEEVPDEEVPDEEVPDVNILQGYSLEELGVTVDLEKLRTFEDPNDSRYTPDYWVLASSMFPGTSKLIIFYTNNPIFMEEIDALYMQGVYTPADPDLEYFLEIDGQRYSLSDLEDFTIYQDEKITVFDVTGFLPIDSFEETIESFTQADSSYSYDWLLEVYEYLKTYEDIAIIYQE